MASHPFYHVDAFTERPLAGNACAVVLDADDLAAETMQAVAREMNLSETTFVIASERADFGARYFTPVGEIPMAGHPTLATIFALVEAGRLPLAGDVTRVTLELLAGVIPIEIAARAGAVREIVMAQPRPRFLDEHPAAEVAPLFGLETRDLLPGHAVQVVSTGTPQLMVPVCGLDALHRASVDYDAYRAHRDAAGYFSAHLFCLEGVTSEGRTFARHFVDPPDFVEDPFTGSATGAMAAYLWRGGLLEEPRFVAEQGHWLQKPGRANVEVVGPRDAIETVRVGGAAATVVTGKLLL